MQNLPDLTQLSHTQKDELIRMLWPLQQQVADLMAQVVVMQDRIKQLEGRLALNSKNSSKPPSSDGLNKPAPKSLRVAGEKPSGGQKGHAGRTLSQATEPDKIVIHNVPDLCQACQRELPFADVNATVQYGPRAQAAMVHLNLNHAVSVQRTAALMKDFFELPVSRATVIKAAQAGSDILRPTVQDIGQAIARSAVAHADESGLRVAKKLHWLHVLATDTLTWMGCHPKRGGEAFQSLALLQQFKGVLGSMTAGCPTRPWSANTPCATPTTCAS